MFSHGHTLLLLVLLPRAGALLDASHCPGLPNRVSVALEFAILCTFSARSVLRATKSAPSGVRPLRCSVSAAFQGARQPPNVHQILHNPPRSLLLHAQLAFPLLSAPARRCPARKIAPLDALSRAWSYVAPSHALPRAALLPVGAGSNSS